MPKQSPAEETPEPRNVAVEVLVPRTKIGKAIVATGPCDFPITKSEADALAALKLARITGIFTTSNTPS